MAVKVYDPNDPDGGGVDPHDGGPGGPPKPGQHQRPPKKQPPPPLHKGNTDPPSTGRGRIVPRHNPPPITNPLPPPVYPTEPPSIPPPIVPRPMPAPAPSRSGVFVPVNDPLPIIYGSVGRVGAQMWYEKQQPDGSFLVIYAVCHGQINSLTNITIEDQPLSTFGLVLGMHYNVYLGTSSQTIDPLLLAAEPTGANAFLNVAYVVIRFPVPTGSQQRPDWARFLCDVQGMLVRDPRTDPTLVGRFYRDNPVLCIADFMTSPARTAADGQTYYYGAGIPDAQLDWSGTITTAANDCDVLLADGVTKRFTMGWIISERRDWKDHVTAMRVHAQLLQPIYNNGLYQIVMDKAQAASGIVITDGIADGNTSTANLVAASSLVVKGSADCPTHVPCNFINPAAAYKNDTTFDDDPGVASGTVELVPPAQNYTFGAIPADQAKRLCRYIRKRLSQDKSTSLYVLNDGGIQVLPGIRIQVTSQQHGWTLQDCVVTDVQTSEDPRWSWTIAVELYNAAIFDDTQATITPVSPPTNQTPYTVPPDILNFTGGLNPYWEPPAATTDSLFGASFWAASGLGAFVAANVNDGNTAVKAFDWNVAADSILTYDSGVGQAHRFCSLKLWGTGNSQGIVEFSDNMSSWTAVTNQRLVLIGSGAQLEVGWTDVGAHRGWRWRKGNTTAQAFDWFEVQFTEITQVYAFTTAYIVYDTSTGTPMPYATILDRAIPTSANPLNLSAIARAPQPGDGGKGAVVKYKVVVQSAGGKQSAGRSTTAWGALPVQSTLASVGGRIIVAPTTKLTADLTAGVTTISVENNNLASGDRVYLESSPAGVAQTEFLAVTSGASGSGPYTYTVTRDLAGTGSKNWKAGDAIVDTGTTGSGFIDLYTLNGTKSTSEHGPTIVGNVRNSATFNDWSPRWAIGNLIGKYDYVSDIFGLAVGDFTKAWLSVDPTFGIRMSYGGGVIFQIDAAGNASFSGAINAGSGTIGGFTIGPTSLLTTNLSINSNSTIGFGSGILSWDAGNTRLNWSGAFFVSGAVTVGNNLVITGNFAGFNGTISSFATCDMSNSYSVGGTRVVSSRGAAVTAPLATIADCQRAINDIIARLSAAGGGHGLIA